MSTRFFTNEGDNTLLKKLAGVFAHNPDIERFDALVDYLRASGYFTLRSHLENVPLIRILVGIDADVDYRGEFEQPKIGYPNIRDKNAFAWDDTKFDTNQKTFIIIGGYKFLLGVLNSTVVTWLFWRLIPRLPNHFFEPGSQFLREFPIPVVPTEKQKPVERLVERILAAKQKNPAADTSALEREIDPHVYALYALTPAEIKLVEEATQK